MCHLLLSDVQSTNLQLLHAILVGTERDMVETCRKFNLHAAQAERLRTLLAKYGIPYLDFMAAPGIDEANWFNDSHHLNTAGAAAFTERLVDSLETRGCLPH